MSAPAPDAEVKPDSPDDLTARSWKYVLRKTAREFGKDQCTDNAAALTYYAVLALFPGLIALLSLVGLVGQGDQAARTVLEVLRDTAIRPMVQNSGNEDDIRIWVPGCSSGEEAYSIAMLFADECRRQKRSVNIQIFATDIDEQMLRIAREGTYAQAALADIPEDMREAAYKTIDSVLKK